MPARVVKKARAALNAARQGFRTRIPDRARGGPLPTQLQHVSVVPFFMALPHRSFSFSEPRAEPMPFVIRVGKAILLRTAGTLHLLLVREYVGDCWLAVHDFCERDHALAFYPQSGGPPVQLAGSAPRVRGMQAS
jgi:hypothetical protein